MERPSAQPAGFAAMGRAALTTSELPAHQAEKTQAVASQLAATGLADDTNIPRPVLDAGDVEPPRQPVQSAASPRSGQLAAAHIDDSMECVICWEATASVVLQPCGHLCACSRCAALLKELLCPMCRCEVLSSIIVQL